MPNKIKTRVGAVSYLNTKPLIYGFEQGNMKNDIELVYDYPARIASMLLNDEIDVGLVPVAVLPRLKQFEIITDYCIGCNGPVASVCLFSEVPVDEIKVLLLDYQSRTSVALIQLLIQEHWKINPVLTHTTADFRKLITGTTAGLVIGDRAFEQRKISPYIYDLGLAWKQLTEMPFVFATWTSNKKLDDKFVQSFNEATQSGIRNLDEVVANNPYDLFDLKAYYTEYISYSLDDNKISGMQLFLKKLSAFKLGFK